MIGRRIDARAERPWVSGIGLGLALVLIAAAVVSNQPGWAIVAVLPLSIAAGLWLVRRSRFTAEVTEEGLLLEDSGFVLPYGRMSLVIAQGQLHDPAFEIHVLHEDGRLVVPAGVNVASRELHDFLVGRLPPGEERPLPPALEDYRQRQAERFGPERIVCYQGRSPGTRPPRPSRAVAVCLAVLAAGLAWVVAGAALGGDYVPFIVFGVVFAVLGLAFAIGFSVDRGRRQVANPQDCAIVLSPTGLAMIQGGLRGELTWREVVAINYPHKPSAWTHSTGRSRTGIGLAVAGATIVVFDIYDQSLPVIHERLRAFWRGP